MKQGGVVADLDPRDVGSRKARTSALRPTVASNENLTSSVVTGWPSCHFMPGRSFTAMVLSSFHS